MNPLKYNLVINNLDLTYLSSNNLSAIRHLTWHRLPVMITETVYFIEAIYPFQIIFSKKIIFDKMLVNNVYLNVILRITFILMQSYFNCYHQLCYSGY